jgi:CRISPR-associated protein Cmr6
MEYPIPKKSAEAWQEHRSKSPQNPGLIFDRFAPDWGSSTDKEAKKKAFQAVEDAAKRVDTSLLFAWSARWETTVRNANADPFSLRTDWRFIAGLGRKGPLEAGFTFHRYGFPLLPGSSVKGIARAWALVSLATALESDRLDNLDKTLSVDEEKKFSETFKQTYPQASQQNDTLAREFRMLFGTTSAAGRAVFFDAIPARLPKLELDIMNPHYPKYYQRNEPPTDSQSPVPVYFLTVASEVEFRFAVGWRGTLADEARQSRSLAQNWLMKGLTELGAGAKTSAGYGYFVAPRR